ncbi:MAG: response regulator [Halobacteria archaeon]|nr:response regulator [Halobacteria archaeon]
MEKYKQLRPDVVTMDIVMPEYTGIEATRTISNNDPDAKIMMCTSESEERKVRQAIENGAEGYITKPFEETNVIREIYNVLSDDEKQEHEEGTGVW